MTERPRPGEEPTKILSIVEIEPNEKNIHARGGLGPDIWKRLLNAEQKLPSPRYFSSNVKRYGEAVIDPEGKIKDERFKSRTFLSKEDWQGVLHLVGGEKALKRKMEPGSDADIALYATMEAAYTYSLADLVSDRLQAENLVWNADRWEQREIKTKKSRPTSYDEPTQTHVYVHAHSDENPIDNKLRRAVGFEPRLDGEEHLVNIPPDEILRYLTKTFQDYPEDQLVKHLYSLGLSSRMPEIFIPHPKFGRTGKRTKRIIHAKKEHYIVPVIDTPTVHGVFIPKSARRHSDDDFTRRKAEILQTGWKDIK